METDEIVTNGDLLLAYAEAVYHLNVCNQRLESIRNL